MSLETSVLLKWSTFLFILQRPFESNLLAGTLSFLCLTACNLSHLNVRCYDQLTFFFYILLTMLHVMILGKWPPWRTILFYVFIFIFNCLHVSSTLCSSSGETNCVNTTSGKCHSVSVAMSCAGWKWTSDLHTTQSDSYQRLCWHSLSLLMMSTMWSKHVES
jgi:hypothetical protein